jgi:hypothetical protein
VVGLPRHAGTWGHRINRRVSATAAVLLPLLVSLAWVPIRTRLPTVDVALALVLAVAACGATGRRAVVGLAAIGAAAGFAYFDTQPYEHWVISRQPDIETLVALAVVSLITGELAVRARRLRTATGPSAEDMDRVREIAGLVASGADLIDVLAAVGADLTRLLRGSACTYEAGPAEAGALVVGRDGVAARGAGAGRARTRGPAPSPADPPRRRSRGGAPTVLEVPVTGMGQVLGRFLVVNPAPTALRRGRLLVALTLADQAGAALIAQAPESATRPDPDATPLRPVLRVVD